MKNFLIKINKHDEYEIKLILKHRRREREFQYNVK